MGQEATTVAVSEPALSFEFDSSQSLFEQLTKAQQTNNSTFANVPNTQPPSHSVSPVSRAVDSMPPPQMLPQQIGHAHTPSQRVAVTTSMPIAMPHEEMLTHMPTYTQMAMNPPLPAQVQKTREQSYGPVMHYDRNGTPVPQMQQRHSSMPVYMEYSPAPSFVSSHFEDYSARGMSFEPMTPPQHTMPQVNETAYIANEDTGLYTAIPDSGMSQFYSPLMPMQQPNMQAPQYPSMIRPLQQSAPGVYPGLEGSPTYKQRRRRSSLNMQAGSHNSTPHAVHRPSDLRHSIPNSAVSGPDTDAFFHDSPASVHNAYSTPKRQKMEVNLSRNATPIEDAVAMPPPMPLVHADEFGSFSTDQQGQSFRPMPAAVTRTANGVFRRARSATVTELGAPYPHKSHSCPIPMCGRLFKRLEHLKR